VSQGASRVPLCPLQRNEIREVLNRLPVQQIAAPLQRAVDAIDMAKRCRHGVCLSFHLNNYQFTKTGSGQAQGNSDKTPFPHQACP
jgi:hypothetical protein